MLFSGLACFSPSVTPTIRKLWVKNGGTLTHTDDDFRRANYFFCDGMDDPWLNELLSRRLIVRHASWVTLCVAEDFCMPIAAYTLDDGFDFRKIRIIEPPRTRKPGLTDATTTIGGASTNYYSSQAPPAVSRRRPFDNRDDSSVSKEEQKQQPPRKKARIDVHALVFPELYDHDPQPHPSSTPSRGESPSTKSVNQVRRFSIFPNPSRKASQAIHQRFLSQIRRVTPVDESNDISTLNPFSLFWNNLLETHLSEDSSCTTAPLTLSVEDLLQAPRTRATIFAVDTDYRGRTFVDLGPASQRDSPA